MYNNKYWDRYLELNSSLRILEHELDGLEKGTEEHSKVNAKVESCRAMMDTNLEMSRLISK